MSLTRDDVKKVAALAKLDLTLAEIDKFAPQLSKILDHISELAEVNTDHIDITSSTTGLVNVLRPDETNVNQSISSDEAVDNTKKKHNGYFVSPLLINK